MAEGGGGRCVFGSASVEESFAKAGNTSPASQAPNAFALTPDPARPGPGVVLMLPYGEAMQAHSALLAVDRGTDGILRHITLRREADEWALPYLAPPVASSANGRPSSPSQPSRRVNWLEPQQPPHTP